MRWKHGAGILHRLQRSTYTFSETDSVSFESSGSVHSAPAWADGKPVQPPVYVLLRNIQLAPGRRRIWISADLTLVRADAESATNERNPRGWSGLTGHSQKRVGYRDGTHIQVDRSPHLEYNNPRAGCLERVPKRAGAFGIQIRYPDGVFSVGSGGPRFVLSPPHSG